MDRGWCQDPHGQAHRLPIATPRARPDSFVTGANEHPLRLQPVLSAVQRLWHPPIGRSFSKIPHTPPMRSSTLDVPNPFVPSSKQCPVPCTLPHPQCLLISNRRNPEGTPRSRWGSPPSEKRSWQDRCCLSIAESERGSLSSNT